jgi:hypothetical protein
MFIPLYRLARIRYEDRLSEADQRRAAAKLAGKTRASGFDKLRSAVVFIGMALLPLGESLRAPVSEQRSLDISAN